jgi:uncharacterized protein with GYD domain
MANYMVLFSFTDQGIRNIKDSPNRVQKAKKTFQDLGAAVKQFYAVMGREFDTVFIVEAPDDETIAKASLAVASFGNVRTQTVRLFTEDEFRTIVGNLL